MKGVEKKRQDIKILDVYVWPHNYKCSTTTTISCVSMTHTASKGKRTLHEGKGTLQVTSVHSVPLSHAHNTCLLWRYANLSGCPCSPRRWILSIWVEISAWCSPCFRGLEANRPTLPLASPFLCVVSLGMLGFHDPCDPKIRLVPKLLYVNWTDT